MFNDIQEYVYNLDCNKTDILDELTRLTETFLNQSDQVTEDNYLPKMNQLLKMSTAIIIERKTESNLVSKIQSYHIKDSPKYLNIGSVDDTMEGQASLKKAESVHELMSQVQLERDGNNSMIERWEEEQEEKLNVLNEEVQKQLTQQDFFRKKTQRSAQREANTRVQPL